MVDLRSFLLAIMVTSFLRNILFLVRFDLIGPESDYVDIQFHIYLTKFLPSYLTVQRLGTNTICKAISKTFLLLVF